MTRGAGTMAAVKISIAGAGVAGLTCGVVLAERGHDVTIVAQEIGVTSLAAAAIWFPYDCEPADEVKAWALTTYERLVPPAGGPAPRGSRIGVRALDVR